MDSAPIDARSARARDTAGVRMRPTRVVAMIDRRLLTAGWLAVTLIASSPAAAQSTARTDQAVKALAQRDCDAAFDALNHGMADNEPSAFYLTGQLYEGGLCLKTDPAKAASTYERGALLGDRESARSLALLFARGAGVPQSYAQAGRWYGVMRREKRGVDAPDARSYEAPDVVERTYVDAVHDLGLQDMTYPSDALGARVTGYVVVRFDPRDAVATVVSSGDNNGSSMNHVGPNKHYFERALLKGYDEAIRALPRPTSPGPGEFATERRVKFDRVPEGPTGPTAYQQINR